MVGLVGVYPRVSTGQQVTDGTSLEGQTELCIKKALEMGFVYDQIKIYREEGLTGEDIDRPSMSRLRDDVASGLITHIICVHPDRLSRDLTDKLIVCREFEKAGVSLVFVDTEYANSPEGQLFFNIQSSVAQYELALIKKRTTRGRLDTVRKKHKVMPMRVPPYGYDLVDGALLIIEDEARFVHMIYEWYIYGRLTMRQIGEKLCELGCYPKRGESKYWGASSIRRVLTSEIYIGRYYYNRRSSKKIRGEKTESGKPRRTCQFRDESEWIVVEVPAIIDEALFEMAQKIKGSNKTIARKIKHDYLLRSLMKCGKCGHAWICTTYSGKGSKANYPIYRCNAKYPRKYGNPDIVGCDTTTVRADLLDEYVWKQITELVLAPDIFFQITSAQKDKASETIMSTLRAVKKQIAGKEKDKDKIKTMYLREVIAEAEMIGDMAKINKELEGLQQEVSKYEGLLRAQSIKLQSADILNKMVTGVRQGIEDERAGIKALSFREKRNILEMLVDEVIIEFRGQEVVLTYIGLLDDLLKKEIAEGARLPYSMDTTPRSLTPQARISMI
jgi:site-specific DNA recombinase